MTNNFKLIATINSPVLNSVLFFPIKNKNNSIKKIKSEIFILILYLMGILLLHFTQFIIFNCFLFQILLLHILLTHLTLHYLQFFLNFHFYLIYPTFFHFYLIRPTFYLALLNFTNFHINYLPIYFDFL